MQAKRNCTWRNGDPVPPTAMLPGAAARIAARFKRAKLEPCGEGCRGWDHFDSGQYGYIIERCDACALFADDAEATKAHTEDCGCNWDTRNWSVAAEAWRRELPRKTSAFQFAGRFDPATPSRGF